MGDSGGGFAIKRDEKWYLRGVVSFGYIQKVDGNKFCNGTMPSLYLDLAEQMEWIKENAFSTKRVDSTLTLVNEALQSIHETLSSGLLKV
jgi:secreted trypsin-like serine protease